MAGQFSLFAPSGIRFSSKIPYAERYFESLRASYGSLWTESLESTIAVETFAEARCLGLAREQLERAANQSNPWWCNELISKREKDYGLIPIPTATLRERQAELAAAMAASGGERMDSLVDGLTALLGSGLIAVVPQVLTTGGKFPSWWPPWSPMHPLRPCNFVPLGGKFKTVRLTAHTLSGTATYEYVAGETEPLIVGEKVVVGPSDRGLTELVTIVSATSTAFTPSIGFAHPHEPGTYCTTATVPYWESGQRFIFVVCTSAVLTDNVLMQRANNYMRRAVGNACQWGLVASSGTGTAGPFTIGSSLLGQTPISTVTY
jgi:hypothetical protein